VVAGDIDRPNGLAFSPDESKLYIVEAGTKPRVIRVYDVVKQGTQLANGRTLITAEADGTPDGLRVDVDGNLWCGWGMGKESLDGVSVFNPTGTLIGRIDLPERCANVCFGGRHRNRLFMCGSTSIYSLYVNTQGVAGG
jgi:gluconolactonase